MELSAPKGPRWEIWIPVVTAVLILAGVVFCVFLQRDTRPDVGKSLTLSQIRIEETGDVISRGSLEPIMDEIRAAGTGEAQTLSDKLPSLELVFSDGTSWTVSFTARPDTLRAETANGVWWIYSEELSHDLSTLCYGALHPEETPEPSSSPAP